MSGGVTRIPLSEVKPNIVLPAAAYDGNSPTTLLLRRGIRVTSELLRRLGERGVTHLSVDSKSAAILRGTSNRAGSPPTSVAPAKHRSSTAAGPAKPRAPATLKDQLRAPAIQLPERALEASLVNWKSQQAAKLAVLFEAAKLSPRISGQVVKSLVSDAVQHVLKDIDAFLKVAVQHTIDESIHEHCLAAAQVAMGVGIVEGFSNKEVEDLGVGCLLSRIGQSSTATQLASEQRLLTSIERLHLHRTPGRTFDILQRMDQVTVGARNVAYQIFERFNGSGYPRRRQGTQIHPLARVAAVCDAFVALTSTRPYRQPFEPYAAVEEILANARTCHFDPKAVRALLRTIGLFPIGSFVELNDGSIGQVVRNDHEHYDRPVVHLYLDADGGYISPQERVVDLKVDERLFVVQALPHTTTSGRMVHSVLEQSLEFSMTPAT